MFDKTRRMLLIAAALAAAHGGAGMGGGRPYHHHRDRSGQPILADRRPSRQGDRGEARLHGQCQRAQGRHQHREHPDRHRDHQQVGRDHSRSGERRRLDRRSQEGGGGQNPGLPRQRRDQPGRPGEGSARLQQRPGRRARRAAMGRRTSATRAIMPNCSATPPTTTPRPARTATRRC